MKPEIEEKKSLEEKVVSTQVEKERKKGQSPHQGDIPPPNSRYRDSMFNPVAKRWYEIWGYD